MKYNCLRCKTHLIGETIYDFLVDGDIIKRDVSLMKKGVVMWFWCHKCNEAKMIIENRFYERKQGEWKLFKFVSDREKVIFT